MRHNFRCDRIQDMNRRNVRRCLCEARLVLRMIMSKDCSNLPLRYLAQSVAAAVHSPTMVQRWKEDNELPLLHATEICSSQDRAFSWRWTELAREIPGNKTNGLEERTSGIYECPLRRHRDQMRSCSNKKALGTRHVRGRDCHSAVRIHTGS